MCLGGSPSAPPPPPALPQAPVTPAPSAISGERSDARRRALTAGSSTILTGPRGITETPVAGAKTLLGQ